MITHNIGLMRSCEPSGGNFPREAELEIPTSWRAIWETEVQRGFRISPVKCPEPKARAQRGRGEAEEVKFKSVYLMSHLSV